MNKIFLGLLLGVIAYLSGSAYALKIEHGQRFRALVLGMDGTKGSQFYERVFLQSQQAPNLKKIADQGQYARCASVTDTHCARTHLGPRFDPAYSWVTSTGWAATLTGVNTDKHLVKENDFESQSVFYKTAQQFPTFLYQLRQRGFLTAAGGVANYISTIDSPGTPNASVSRGILDFECGVDYKNQRAMVDALADTSCNASYRHSLDGDDPERDARLTDWLLSMINNSGVKKPDVIMGVYDTIDHAGHVYGYDSNPGYLRSISNVDAYVGRILEAIQQRVETTNEVWLVIITSDHGGHMNADGTGGHDQVRFDDEAVPFVSAVFGKNIRLQNSGEMQDLNVSQMDTSPSVLHWFDVAAQKSDGVVRSQYVWK
jgi:hypothetical protein